MSARYRFSYGRGREQVNLPQMGANLRQLTMPTRRTRLGPTSSGQQMYEMVGFPQLQGMSQMTSQRLKTMFKNNVSGSTVPNVPEMMSGLSQNQQDGTNVPITANLVARPFDGEEEKNLRKGDVLFVSSKDTIEKNHKQLPQRTVTNLQMLNRFLFEQKGIATQMIINEMMKTATKYKLKLNSPLISIDLDAVITRERARKGYLYENFDLVKDSRDAHKIMEKQFDEIMRSLDVLGQRQSQGDNIILKALVGTGKAMCDKLDSHQYSYLMDINKLVLDRLVFYIPSLIFDRWKPIGVMMDRTASPRDPRFQKTSTAHTVTYAVRGPVWTTNIFGDVAEPNVRTRGPKPITTMPVLNETSKIFLALVMDKNQYNYNGIEFVPIWIRPFCSTTKTDMINELVQSHPLIERTYLYKKVGRELVLKRKEVIINNESISGPVVREFKFPRSQVPTFLLGTIINFQNVKKINQPGFFEAALGIKNYGSVKTSNNVLELRKACGKVKLNVKT
jgi:hypothetical protein